MTAIKWEHLQAVDETGVFVARICCPQLAFMSCRLSARRGHGLTNESDSFSNKEGDLRVTELVREIQTDFVLVVVRTKSCCNLHDPY
eukprot:1021377-Rhodomonas_salina.2